MKKLLVMIVAVLSVSACMAQQTISEQKAPRKQMTVSEITQNMVSKLKLDDSQAQKLSTLNQKYSTLFQRPSRPGRPESAEKGENNGSELQKGVPAKPSNEEMSTKMKEMQSQREAYEKELKAILTDSQYESYQKMRPGKGPKGGNRPSDDKQ